MDISGLLKLSALLLHVLVLTNAQTCPELICSGNGKVKQTVPAQIGDKAKYKCNEGFALIGEKKRKCVLKNGVAEWNGKEPKCIAEPPSYECPRRWCPEKKQLFLATEKLWTITSGKKEGLEQALLGTNNVAKDIEEKYCMSCKDGKPFLMLGFGFSIKAHAGAIYRVEYDGSTVFSNVNPDKKFLATSLLSAHNNKILEVCIVVKNCKKFDLKDMYLLTCRDETTPSPTTAPVPAPAPSPTPIPGGL